MKKLLPVIALLILIAVYGSGAGAQPEAPWDLRKTTQAGMFTFYDTPASASTTGKPLDIGDFDGNGCGDLAITGQNASPLGRGSAGHLRIVMNLCRIGGQLVMESAGQRPGVFSIYGAYAGDMAGTETYIDDFNQEQMIERSYTVTAAVVELPPDEFTPPPDFVPPPIEEPERDWLSRLVLAFMGLGS